MRVRRALWRGVDFVVVVLCLPFCMVALPAARAHQWLARRRPIRTGQEVTHWIAPDVRLDYLAVDESRIHEGLVGIRFRCVNVLWLGSHKVPEYEDRVVYINTSQFWLPSPLPLAIQASVPKGRIGDARD